MLMMMLIVGLSQSDAPSPLLHCFSDWGGTILTFFTPSPSPQLLTCILNSLSPWILFANSSIKLWGCSLCSRFILIDSYSLRLAHVPTLGPLLVWSFQVGCSVLPPSWNFASKLGEPIRIGMIRPQTKKNYRPINDRTPAIFGKWLRYDGFGSYSSQPTLGSPLNLVSSWRPLATIGDMLENGHFGGNFNHISTWYSKFCHIPIVVFYSVF